MRASLSLLLALSLLAGCASAPEPAAGQVYPFLADERPAGPRARDPIESALLVEVVRDEVALDYVVKSRIYAEDPSSLFLTLRGGGVSVYDVSEPSRPRLISRACEEHDVEGQDRLGDLLVIVARAGRLLTFDASDPKALKPLGSFELDTSPSLGQRVRGAIFEAIGTGPFTALHTALYRPSPERTVALVSAPDSRELLAIDVTDPRQPRQVGAVDTRISFVEAVVVKDGYAFVGGFGNSQAFTAIDVRDPSAMKIARTLEDPSYRQLVGQIAPERPNHLFVALWDDPGGLGAFDVTNPAEFRQLDLLLAPELARANRTKLAGDYAFLPLERKPGGFAAVDISRPEDLRLAVIVEDIPGVSLPYTCQAQGNWLYVFGTRTCSMAIFELKRGRKSD